MAQFLLVPTHIEALWANTPTVVASAWADFTLLPWSNGQRDINPDTPYLSEAILSPAFQDQQLTLQPGLHLHWSVPKALSRQIHTGGDSAQSTHWTRAPNRWLVTRRWKGHSTQQWLIESDFLHPPGAGQQSIAWPMQGDVEKGAQPWRRLGRVVPLQAWGGNQSSTGEHVEHLSTAGYGDPGFGSWYPACHSVFGFHDADVREHDKDALHYEVLGWFDSPEHDPLHPAAPISNMEATRGGLAALTRHLKWKLPETDNTGAKAAPERTICFSRCQFDDAAATAADTAHHVSIAPTGGEALSALLAQQLEATAAKQRELEDKLESLDLASALEHRSLDIGAKFREARHEKGFVASPAGHLWVIKAEQNSAGKSGDQPHAPVLPPALALALDQANQKQQRHDEGLERVASLRDKLFADWCKYQHCSYPAEGMHESYPDADQVRDFIERGALLQLEEAEAVTGQLQIKLDSDNRLQSAAATTPHTSAAAAAGALSALIDSVEMFGSTGFSGQLHGPRRIVSGPARGYALRFDGRQNRLQPDHFVDTPLPELKRPSSLAAMTVSVWLRSNGSGVIASWDEEINWSLAVDTSGQLVFVSTDGNKFSDVLGSHAMVADGQWHHVAIRYSNAERKKSIWIDGELDIQLEAHEGWPLGTGAPCLGCIGAKLVLDPDSTDTGADIGVPQQFFQGDLAQFRWQARALSDAQMQQLPDAAWSPSLSIRRTPSARYWQPREPVVLLQGPIASRARWHSTADALPCALANDPILAGFDQVSGAAFDTILQPLREALNALQASATAATEGFHTLTGEEFEPLYMEWQAEFWPVKDGYHEHTPDGRYSADYVTGACSFDQDGVDLQLQPGSGRVDSAAAVFSGRTILSHHAGPKLREQIQQFLDDNPNQAVHQDLSRALALLESDAGVVLSQALSGFNAALLQRAQTYQLPVRDPLQFSVQSPFTSAVAAAIGSTGVHSALPNNAFIPVAAGAMRLLRLRLLDRFGRTREIDVSEIARPTRYAIAGSEHLLRMPPRLAQPAQLEFRWLAASAAVEQMNDLSHTSPVCGWLLPNNLDDRVAVYSHTLKPLGRIGVDARGLWHPVPGHEAAVQPRQILNPRLRRVVQWLLAQPESFHQSGRSHAGFRERLESALENIHPATAAQHNGVGLLMGAPLALVRIKLRLVLQGPAVVNQDWTVLRRNMHTRQHDDSGLTTIGFPVRLGASHQFNDGLVGYWLEDEHGELIGDFIDHREETPIHLTPNGAAQTVSVLLDPRCHLHAATGILPVKAIDIPPAHYADALASIGASFLTAPILTPTDKLELSLPPEAGYAWQWIMRENNQWEKVAADAIDNVSYSATFSGTNEIREGWLQLLPVTEDELNE